MRDRAVALGGAARAGLLVVFVGGCAHAPMTTIGVVEATWRDEHLVPIRFPEVGDCGGLASLPASVAVSPIDDRVRLRLPVEPRAVEFELENTLLYPPLASEAQVLWLERGDAVLAVTVEETYLIADELAALAGYLGPDWRVETLPGGRVAFAVLAPALADESHVLVARAYLVGPDSLVRRIGFVAARDTASRGGCVDVARAIAATLEPGDRAIRTATTAETWPIGDGLAIDLPAGFRATMAMNCTGAWIHVHGAARLGAPRERGTIEIFMGAEFAGPYGRFTERVTSVSGDEVTWYDRVRDGAVLSDATLRIGERTLHVAIEAPDQPALDRLAPIAASIHPE